jgi:TrmH family RNA methyltransferase
VDLKKARKFASHGVYVLDNAEICTFDNLKKFDYKIGTTAIFDVSTTNVLRSTVSPKFMADAIRKFSGSVCLIFGRDTVGLTNEELESLDMIVSIYADSSYPTLNIGHSVAIILYELTKQQFENEEKIANEEQRSRIVKFASNLARESGYKEYKLPIFERAFSQLIGRGRPTSREATLIIGLFRKVTNLIKNKDHNFSKT